MRQADFTPGPYVVVQRGHDKRKPIEVRAWNRNPHAKEGPLICKMSDANGRLTTLANADLLAAAPELLEAAEIGAKWMREWLDEDLCECEGTYGHECGRTQRENELARILAAIAKARSEE